MSYAHNDHYKWIESCYDLKCSPLGKEVANILGYVGGGIYNAPFATEKVNWTGEYSIIVNWNSSLSNWDFPQLTKLVIECHRRMIRVCISPNMRSIKMIFHKRNTRDKEAGISQRMPDIEEMIHTRDVAYGLIKE
jgi:hypothetical protein